MAGCVVVRKLAPFGLERGTAPFAGPAATSAMNDSETSGIPVKLERSRTNIGDGLTPYRFRRLHRPVAASNHPGPLHGAAWFTISLEQRKQGPCSRLMPFQFVTAASLMRELQ